MAPYRRRSTLTEQEWRELYASADLYPDCMLADFVVGCFISEQIVDEILEEEAWDP